MTLAVVALQIKTGQTAKFETPFGEARKLVTQTAGNGGLTLRRCTENSEHFVLLLEWLTVAQHMEGFRNPPQYPRWRELFDPDFASAPGIEHFKWVH